MIKLCNRLKTVNIHFALLLFFLLFNSPGVHAEWLVSVEKNGKRSIEYITPKQALKHALKNKDKIGASAKDIKKYYKARRKVKGAKATKLSTEHINILLSAPIKGQYDIFIPNLEYFVPKDEESRPVSTGRLTTTFPWGECVNDDSDMNTCNALADLCNYTSCSPGPALQGQFGGCSGLVCACRLDDGSTFGDVVSSQSGGTINTGTIACDEDIPPWNRNPITNNQNPFGDSIN